MCWVQFGLYVWMRPINDLESILVKKRMQAKFFNCSLSAGQWSQVWKWCPLLQWSNYRRGSLGFLNRITVKRKLEVLPLNGGAIGFVGYDLINFYENIGSIPEDTIGTPDSTFLIWELCDFWITKEKVYAWWKTSIVDGVKQSKH